MTASEEKGSEKRLLPVVIDETARASPQKVFAITPRTGRIEDGYSNTTFAQVARAVNKVAWWLDQKLGSWPTGVEPEMLAYMGPRDLRYSIIVVAAMKTNRQVFLPMSQLSPEATIHLINLTQPSTLIGTTDLASVWDGVVAAKPKLRVLTLPALDELYRDVPVQVYPYTKTWAEAKNDPIHVNHTSGTTGLPKPVSWTNATAATITHSHHTPPAKELAHTLLAHKTIIVTLPPSWLPGLLLHLHFPTLLSTTPILPPPLSPHPLPPTTINTLHQAHPTATAGLYTPTTLHQLAKNPAHITNMRHLSHAFYLGAALDKAVGDHLATFLTPQPLLGTPQTGALPLLPAHPRRWDRLRFDPDHPSGARLVPHNEDGMFELVLQRQRSRARAQYQPVFQPRGEADAESEVWRTGLLFEECGDGDVDADADADGEDGSAWLFVGREADFVTLASGVVFNAGQVEDMIARHPGVRAAVMGGEGRRRPFVLVELEGEGGPGCFRDGRERGVVLEGIWDVFDEVNKCVVEGARFRRELVLFAGPEKGVVRTAGMGGVERGETLRRYGEEVEKMYRASGWA